MLLQTLPSAMTLALIALFAAGSCVAASAGEDIHDVIAAAGNPSDHPGSKTVTAGSWTQLTVAEDGSSVMRIRTVIKVLTEAGRDDAAAQRFPYIKSYMNLEVPIARVIRANGTIEDIRASSIVDGTMTETQQMNIFEDNFRQKTVSAPPLNVGDSVEIHVVYESKPLLKNHFSTMFPLQESVPVVYLEIEMTAPASMNLRWVVLDGDVEEEKTLDDKQLRVIWRKRNAEPVINELGMVPLMDVATRILISSFKDWPELSRYGESLNEGKLIADKKLRDKVRELTAGLKTEEEKVAAIYRFVSTKIRYMGSSMDVGAFLEPHAATYTLEQQYGVCRDKSVLMLTMLNEIGVAGDDVLINVSRQTDPELPMIFFEHAICRVQLSDGRELYMDPTLELSASIGEPYVGGRYVLPLTAEGSDLVQLPLGDPSASLGHIEAHSVLREDGTVTSQLTISGVGIYEFMLRSIARMSPGFEFAMLWQQLLQGISPGAKLLSPNATDAFDLATPFTITLCAEFPDYLTDIEEYQLLKIPMATNGLDLPFGLSLTYITALPDRQYPLFLFSPFGCTQQETLTIPDCYEIVSVPGDFTLEQGPVTGECRVVVDGQTVTFTSDYRVRANVLPVEDYRHLRQLFRDINKLQKSMIILKRKPA